MIRQLTVSALLFSACDLIALLPVAPPANLWIQRRCAAGASQLVRFANQMERRNRCRGEHRNRRETERAEWERSEEEERRSEQLHVRLAAVAVVAVTVDAVAEGHCGVGPRRARHLCWGTAGVASGAGTTGRRLEVRSADGAAGGTGTGCGSGGG